MEKSSFKVFRKIKQFVNTTLLGGLTVVLPFTLLVVVVRFLFNLILSIITPIKNLLPFSEGIKGWLIDITALGGIIVLFFLIGLAVRTSLGKELWNYFEKKFLLHLPFYSILRDTVQQFFGQGKVPFSKVVAVDVFNTGTQMIGFVSAEISEGKGMYSIFVPTGPNPTNGFIFLVEKEQVTLLDIKSEEAMRMIIGVGTGSEKLLADIISKSKH
ncbi:MAG: hypothetical protein RLZZ248_1340 [Bacteroidota bacterium]